MRKETATTMLVILMLAFVLTFGLGLVLAGNWGASTEYRVAVEALRLDTAARMRWIQIAFWAGLVAIVLVGLGGVVGALLRVVWQRSRIIQPHTSGLFPIVEGRAGGQTYYHDPNRQWAGTTVYGVGPEGADVRYLAPPDQQETQFQIATQAQATQFVAAASQGRGLNASTRDLAGQLALAAPARPVPHLPDIVVLDESVPQERRLLAALHQDWIEADERRAVTWQ